MLVNRTLPTVVRIAVYDVAADETTVVNHPQAGQSLLGLICGPRYSSQVPKEKNPHNCATIGNVYSYRPGNLSQGYHIRQLRRDALRCADVSPQPYHRVDFCWRLWQQPVQRHCQHKDQSIENKGVPPRSEHYQSDTSAF